MAYAGGLYYETHGDDAAPPLILVSGLGGSAGYWVPNLPALTRDYRVIAFDHRGTGRSDRAIGERATIDALADDIALLMRELGLSRAAIVGHAIGGMAGLVLALAKPEQVARLVVINGWARLDPYTARCFEARLALLHDSGPLAYIRAQPIFLFPPQWISDHHDHLSSHEVAQVEDFPVIATMDKRIRGTAAFDILDALGSMSVPVLYVASEDDALVPPACSDRLHAATPGSRIVRLPYGGHGCNVTDPETIAAAIMPFLRS